MEKLKGIIPPLVTPLLDRDTLDTEGLGRLIDHVIAGGVHGIFALGTTGEAPSLSIKLRQEAVAASAAAAGKRVPVLVGITDSSFVESVNLAQYAAEQGADAVVLAPPYYFPAGQEELLEYLEHLAAEMPLPLVLYNMPSHTKLMFEPATVAQAAELEGVVGLKDSSGNMTYFHELQQRLKSKPHFALLVGPEQLLAETVCLSGDGGVCGGANLFPELYVKLYEAARDQEHSRVRQLHETVMVLGDELYSTVRFWSSYLKGLKCALAVEGICSDFMAEPFHKFREAEHQAIVDALARIKPQVAAALKV